MYNYHRRNRDENNKSNEIEQLNYGEDNNFDNQSESNTLENSAASKDRYIRRKLASKYDQI